MSNNSFYLVPQNSLKQNHRTVKAEPQILPLRNHTLVTALTTQTLEHTPQILRETLKILGNFQSPVSAILIE